MTHKHTRGIYKKFYVERTDGQSEMGRKHDGCEYFVLDLTHDKHAPDAIRAYANSCRNEFPMLAADLDGKFPQQTHDAETVERVRRALWIENQCDSSYDEALLGAERGYAHDIAALKYNNDMARAALSAMPPQEVSVPTLQLLRRVWRRHGGDWHGPKVETWTIPEDNFIEFFNDALRALSQQPAPIQGESE